MSKEVLSVIVDNHAGVLTRITSLFSRRGFNIDSLTVSATDDEHVSRITIVLQGNEQIIEQVISQTLKLEEVQNVFVLDDGESLFRELLLVKLAAGEEKRGKIREIADIYGASIVDLSPDSMVLELTGKPSKMDGFIKILSDYEILEMCRTGITALERGNVRHTIHKVK
ncbi:MAG: acetolactate synthase small subunit [Oscillospiraceae bacterium]